MGRSSGRDRKPTIDYQACYYQQRRSFFRGQKLVFNAGFVAFFWPGGGPRPVITILSSPMTTRFTTIPRSTSRFAVAAGFMGASWLSVEKDRRARVLQCVSSRNIGL